MEIVEEHPDYKKWVVHNKTVPIEILEILTLDINPDVRSAVARKRKLSDKIFKALSVDADENVRYALMCNTKLNHGQLRQIKVDDSEWLISQLRERLARTMRSHVGGILVKIIKLACLARLDGCCAFL